METIITVDTGAKADLVQVEEAPLQVPAPKGEVVAPLVKPSGAREALREAGRAIGWITWPVWRPLQIWGRLMHAEGEKILRAPRIAVGHVQAWRTLVVSSGARWDGWTQAERLSVTRQQGVWALLLAGAVVVLSAGEGWLAFGPLFVLSGLWWLRSHNTRLRWHFDVVRWGLGLPQVPEHVLRGEVSRDQE